jgi:hypothetical protein
LGVDVVHYKVELEVELYFGCLLLGVAFDILLNVFGPFLEKVHPTAFVEILFLILVFVCKISRKTL